MKWMQKGMRCLAVGMALLLAACSSSGGNKAAEGSGQDMRGGVGTESSQIQEEAGHYYLDQVTGMEETGTVYSQTILIYMVGSDLETYYGNATKDLQEMILAEPDTTQTHILVYAGGATRWQNASLSSEEDRILELTDEGFVERECMEAQNMGEADTLASFLSYGMAAYDTDQYGLILWDHGGGPVGGFGADERYDYDLLDLMELQTALDTGLGASRLTWIGFDACLMSTLEIADVLAPYGDYLIASQETEPGYGWDYSFLSQLSQPDMDGPRIGKAIVDAYIDYGLASAQENWRTTQDLTLSCLNLGQYQGVEDAWNAYFQEMDGYLSVDTFPATTRSRNRAKLFGGYFTDFDYGLVDAAHLLQLLSQASGISADGVLAAMTDMVCYMRSNVENANGVSVCYPNRYNEPYAQVCHGIQQEVGFAQDYVDFWQSCQEIATGAAILSNWSVATAVTQVVPMTEADTQMPEVSVETQEETMVQQGRDISLALTEEQQQNFGTATYYIFYHMEMDDADEDPLGDQVYLFVHQGGDLEMDEEGVLHAYYYDQVIYIRNAMTGDLSPYPMVLQESNSSTTEQRYLSRVVLEGFGNGVYEGCAAELQVVVDAEHPNGEIRQAIPIGDAEKEVRYATKELVDIEDYSSMSVVGSVRYLSRDLDGNILPYDDWESTGWISGFEVETEEGFELEMRPIEDPENYFCLFVVEDSQGNRSMSDLIPLAAS